MRKVFLYILALTLSTASYSQIGGNYVYGFLETDFSFSASALASSSPAVALSSDAFLYNPAFADTLFNRRVSLGYYNYLSDVNAGSFFYNDSYKKFVFFGGIEYFNYGKFEGYDEQGNATGNFTASDYAFIGGAALLVDSNLTLGIAFKPVFSRMEQYFSWGIAADLGLRYHFGASDFSLVFRNFGKQIKPYNNLREPLPFNINASIATKLKYAPFRPVLSLEHLENWNLYYDSPLDSLYNQVIGDTIKVSFAQETGREFIRHLSVGTEIIFSKNFSVFAGYNFRRAKELSIPAKAGLSGLSLAMQIKMSKFSFGYSWNKYHVAASGSFFYFSFNPNVFKIKNKRL